MGLVRILVDGFSLLHNWPELAPGKPRHSAAAREELISCLTQYHDTSGTPVTIVFDGAQASREQDETSSTADVEILYSRAGQSTAHVIARAASRLIPYGEVMVVTDDFAEQQTVSAAGGAAVGCATFVRSVQTSLADLQRELQAYNQQERSRFQAP